MQTPMRRRALLTLSLSVAAVAATGIAVADGPSVDDVVTDLALDGIGPNAAVDLELPASVSSRDELVPTQLDPVELVAAPAVAEPTVEPTADATPRTPQVATRSARVATDDSWTGTASWYGPGFDGRLTANGETYDMYAMTAAHKTLPFGTMVEVTNLANGATVVVRINDRGPFVGNREIDLSLGAADALGFAGLADVRLEIV